MNLSLGTAQFGSAYGITNLQGAPSKEDIFSVLDMFVADGNSFLDSAQDYGDAHKKISEWLRERDGQSIPIKIVTKISIKFQKDIESLQSNVIKICNELSVKNIYGILIHNPSNLIGVGDWDKLNDQFNTLKENGTVEKTGISLYGPEELLDIYDKLPEINIIQCPINILDQRFLHPEFQNFCAQRKIEIQARSLFLQGLLLTDFIPEKILDAGVKKIFEEYRGFLKKNHLTSMEACCLFAHQNEKKVSTWVVGFNFSRELKEFLLQLNTLKNSAVSFNEFNKNSYVDPRTWSYVKC